MARTYLEYFIYLTDLALVRELQGTRFRRMVFGGIIPLYSEAGHPIMAPDDAATEWSAPIQLGDASAPKVGPPNCSSDYFTHAYSNFPRNRATFTIDGGGFWGWLPWVGDKDYAWRGTFIYAGVAVGESPVPGEVLAAMSKRRWIDGMETISQGENYPVANDQGNSRTCRAASRSLQGLGFHVDAPSGTSYREHVPTTSGGAATNTLWERFYIRVHRFGLAEFKIWKVTTPASQNGLEVGFLPSGQIYVTTVSGAGTRVLLGTFGTILPVHVWQKIDLVYSFQTVGLEADFKMWLNGTLICSLNGPALGPAAQGLRVVANISICAIASTIADTSVSVDFDDWIGADPPNPTLSSKDWNAGSHVAMISAQGFAADHEGANWTGDWRLLRQKTGTPVAAIAQPVSSAVSGARISIATDAGLEVDGQQNGRGIAAMVVTMLARRPGGTAPANSGTLGYKLPGGVDVLQAIAESAGKIWLGAYHFPAGLLEPITPLRGLELKHVRGANVETTGIEFLGAVAEIIGIFGPEDAVALTAAQLATPGAVAAGPDAGSASLVQSVKDGLIARGAPLSGACGAFSITKRVAWALRASGGGLLSKPSGNNCEGYSTDIVAFKGVGVTRIFDMLIDGGGTNGPTWSEGTPIAGLDRWRAAVDPGDASDSGTEGIAAWDGGDHAYAVGDRVTRAGAGTTGNEYVCIVEHTSQTADVTLASAGPGTVNGDDYWQNAGGTLTAQAGEPIVVAPHVGLHNAPYPRSAWAGGAAPFSPVIVKTGSYVGNGTFTELFFDAPIHFLWIRPLTAGSGPVVWFPGMNYAHSAGQLGTQTPYVEVLMDPLFAGAAAPGQAEQRCVVRISGNAVECNQAAATYAYLALGDPGMRFLMSDALQVTSGPLDYVNPLPHESWTPEALWLMGEVFGTGVTVRLGYKGSGHAVAAITKQLGFAEVAAGLQFGLGTVTLKTGLFTAADNQVSYCAFRRNDSSGDPGASQVVQLGTYVGDGNASRTIALAPASGQRPMWAIVIPHTAVNPVMRDPSHLGTTSTTWPSTANAATGIVGGDIDSILIGIALNANGVVYDVFAIPGCDGAAGAAGWSTACQTDPVAPWTPPGGPGTPWPAEPIDPETPEFPWPGDDTGTGGGTPTDDFGSQCVEASTLIINQALARLGIGKRVDDIVLEQSEEAATARLLYVDDVSATLRDYPWPFATRYAQLELVAGSETAPVNGDWTYAYRTPENMMFARRLVRRGGLKRAFDPLPIDFRIGSDDDGTLIYTNHQEPGIVVPSELTVELEYTVRMSCAASQGDAIFRSALAWRHAHSLAPILSRDEKKVVMCWSMYLHVLGTAETKAAQETQQGPAGDADWITGRN